MITVDDIKQARKTIAPYIKRTPLERSETLSRRLGTNVYVKYELFQKTGSFKPRGAFNTILSLTDDERQHGVVAVSGGNHAQGVAYAATTLGVESLILMPANTPQNYLDAARGYGATVELLPNIAEAFAYIHARSPLNAERWLRELYKAVRTLERFPGRCGRARESDYVGEELKQYIFKSYRIIFRIEPDEKIVRVLHVRHAARRAIGEPPGDGD
jgi:plasmid stabilization system protein ParE